MVIENKQLALYISYLQNIKKFSPNTIRAYRQDISQFVKYLDSRNLGFQKEGIRDFISETYLKTRSKTTVSRKIYAIRSFTSYLLKNGIIDKNPMDVINIPKVDKKIPEILTIDEMIAFLDRLPEKGFIQLRNKAMFELLYATGLRVSELTHLKFHDIDFEKGLLRVLGKGRKERIVPFNDKAGDFLDAYLREKKRKFRTGSDYIFVNLRGNRITERSIERILSETYRKLMKNDKKVYPHLFRHSFATHLLQRGANLRVIQELLGHANLSTTEKYTTLNFSDLLKVYRQFHPRSQ